MKLSDFKYNLPKTSVAKYPATPRDKSKLMVLDREKQEIESKVFTDVCDYMEKGMFLLLMRQGCSRQDYMGRKRKRPMRRLKFFF